MNHKIKDVFDIEQYMKTTNLKYNMNGKMYFEDMMYLTYWEMGPTIHQSSTHFTHSKSEYFEIDLLGNQMPRSWNQFGFKQKFNDDEEDELFTPYHSNQHLEMYIVLSGNFKLRIQGEIVELTKGQVVVLNQNALHSDYFSGDNASVLILGLNDSFFNQYFFQVLNDRELERFISNTFNTSIKDSEYWIYDAIESLDLFVELLNLIHEEISEKKDGHDQILSVYLLRVFLFLKSQNVKKKVQEDSLGLRMIVFNEVERYIKQNYQDISLEKLSHFMKFSKDYFNRLIKDVTGLTYGQYLQQVRITVAKDLLITSDHSVQEVASLVGYQNVSHFYELFKNHVDLTPNDYREKFKP